VAPFPRRRRKSFQSLLHAISGRCRGPLRTGVRRSRADRYVKRHRSVDLALALVSYFLLDLRSLRGLKRHLDGDRLVAECVGWRGMSIAQLSKSLHDRPPQLWEPLIAALVQQVRRSAVPGDLRVIDSTLLKLGHRLLTRCTGKSFQNPGNAGIQATFVLDVVHLTPVAVRAKVGQGSDAANGRLVVPADETIAGQLYLFDRGFRNYAFFEELIARGADFITRQSATIHYTVDEDRSLDPAHPQIVADQTVHLGSANAKNRMTHPVRRIVLQTATEPVIFLTSCFDLSAHEVTELYRQRWVIETFFRWLKRVIGCDKPLGYSQSAGLHTIYAAMVAYLLALLLAGLHPPQPRCAATARIKAVFGLLRALLYQRPRRDHLHALGFV